MVHVVDTERIERLLRMEREAYLEKLSHDSGVLVSRERGEIPAWHFLPDRTGLERPYRLFNGLQAIAQVIQDVQEGNPCFAIKVDAEEDKGIHPSVSDWMARFHNRFGDACGHLNVEGGEVHLYTCSWVKLTSNEAQMLQRIKSALRRDALLLYGLHSANHHEKDLDECAPVERFFPKTVESTIH
jgi:hypothetical protein